MKEICHYPNFQILVECKKGYFFSQANYVGFEHRAMNANNYFLFTTFVWRWYCIHNSPFCLVVHQSMSELLSFRGYFTRNETSYEKVWHFVLLLLIILKFYFIGFNFMLFKTFYTKLILIDFFFSYEHPE